MYTKQQFLESIRNEAKICKHLFSKIPEGKMDYRPTEGQRSVLELLQYISRIGSSSVRALVNKDWSQISEDIARAKTLSPTDFPAVMDREIEEVTRMLEGLSEEELLNRKTVLPFGAECALGESLVNLPLRFYAAYRMQLFLYLKFMGVPNLSTLNCWRGMDNPEPKSES